MSEERTIEGTRYVRDAYGFIWRHNDNPSISVPERWFRTGYASFEMVQQIRSRNSEE